MPEDICIRPQRDGVEIMHPRTGRFIPREGAKVPRGYGLRRIADGDAVEIRRPGKPKAAGTDAATAEKKEAK